MALTKVRGAGAEGLTLSTTDLKIDSGDLVFSTADKGVVLGATSNTDANTLDDYEEGSWTPVFKDNNSTVVTIAQVSGFYRKVGKLVTTEFSVQKNDATSASNAIYLTGLPFTSAAIPAVRGHCWVDNSSSTDIRIFIYLGSSNTEAFFVAAGTSNATLNTNNWENSRYIYGSLTYTTA